MPRFDNEGFNPNRRIDNDKRDRTVPTDENYYGASVDLNFNSKQKAMKPIPTLTEQTATIHKTVTATAI